MDKKTALPTIPADPAALEAFVDASAALCGIVIEPAYRDGVKIHLNAVTNAAKAVLAADLEDEAEPAPVFKP